MKYPHYIVYLLYIFDMMTHPTSAGHEAESYTDRHSFSHSVILLAQVKSKLHVDNLKEAF